MDEDPYKALGVDYDVLDAAKRAFSREARRTTGTLLGHGGQAVEASRGEPAFVFRLGGLTLAVVLECVGTKSLLTRRYEEEAGVGLYGAIAHDGVAAVVNDLVCVGALPLTVNAYFAAGGADFYDRADRVEQLAAGWRGACLEAEAAWAGGESPSLPDLVATGELEIAGSAVGYLPGDREPLVGDRVAADDAIVLVASSGLHANGASIARRVASQLPDGLTTRLPSGTTFGAALLEPTRIYVRLVRRLLERQLPVGYLSNVTGHGLRKLMRPARELSYELHALPPVPEVLRFLVDAAGMDPAGAYGTFNMGAGFAVYCRPEAADAVVEVAADAGYQAVVAGRVRPGPRRVVLDPIGCTFSGSELRLR